LVSVTTDSVRNLVHLTNSDIDDTKVAEFLAQAAVEINLETGLTIVYTNCTEAEAAAVRLLAAVYCLCYVTGGSAAGLNFSVGDLHVDVLNQVPPLSVLQVRLERMIEKLTTPYLGRV